jgi:hypothetical protein
VALAQTRRLLLAKHLLTRHAAQDGRRRVRERVFERTALQHLFRTRYGLNPTAAAPRTNARRRRRRDSR